MNSEQEINKVVVVTGDSNTINVNVVYEGSKTIRPRESSTVKKR